MAVVFNKYEDQATDENLERLYQNVDLTRPNDKILSDKAASALRLTTVSNQTMAESVEKLAQFIANKCRLFLSKGKYSVWPMMCHKNYPTQIKNLLSFHCLQNGEMMEPIWTPLS